MAKWSKTASVLMAAAIGLGGTLSSPGAFAQFERETVSRRVASEYVVRPGDTLSSIARAADVPLGVILGLNPNVDPQDLRVGDRILVPGQARGPARGSIAIRPDSGTADSTVAVSGRGFRPDAPVRLLVGRGPYDLRRFERLRADSAGRVSARVDLPEWARPGRPVFFALESMDGRLRVVSEPFRVVERSRRPDRLRVSGTLTRGGVECPAMRGDDGRTYSLLGDLRGFRPGDRVLVEGRRAEMSICMQGTALEIRRIEEAD